MKEEVKILPTDLFNHEEGGWNDYYLELRNLKKGDLFYECTSHGENYELRVIENAKKVKKNAWICKVQKINGEIVELYASGGTSDDTFSYPAPNFFRIPQHITQLDSGKYAYIVK